MLFLYVLGTQTASTDDHDDSIPPTDNTGYESEVDLDCSPPSDNSEIDPDYIPSSDNNEIDLDHILPSAILGNEMKVNVDCNSLLDNTKKERETISVDYVPPSDDESEIIQCILSQDLPALSASSTKTTINVLTTSNAGGRHYDKKFYCLYCEKPQAKLPRHLETKHKDETEVSKYLTATNKKSKQNMMLKLRNLGNYKHNSEVLRQGSGDLIVAYRPSVTVPAEHYTPCEYCLGYYASVELWKHVQRCALAPTDRRKYSKVIQSSRLLLPCPDGTSDGLKEVLATFSIDEIAVIVKRDPLILQLGERLYRKHGHDKEQFCFIRNTLRELGRLLRVLRENTNQCNKGLREFIDPSQFQQVTEATRQVAGFSNETHFYTTPSLALKIGHSLKKCAKILKGFALQTDDEDLLKKANSFEELCELEWQNEVSAHALRSLEQKKRNNIKLIPLTEDVKLLTSYLTEKSEEAYLKLIKETDVSAWSTLNETTLAQVILFNRRRQGEASKMTIKDFEKRHSAADYTNVAETLSPLEKKLCNTLERIELVGKKGRTVPVILAHVMKRNIELLIKTRDSCGVSEANKFVFARAHYGSECHIRGSDCLRNFSESCGAKFPTLLRSTKLRKQIATLSQIMNLKDHELDILANFLGHDIRVHREFYRLPEETLEVAKVSKLLLLMEKGDLSEMKGKTLDEIQVDISEGKF